MFKRALVSVSDKSGLVEFLKPYVEGGLQVVSTGGTYKFLKENGIKVVSVEDVTGFPEVMDGRVRTLHPNIHMGLLSRPGVQEDSEVLKKFNVTPFDLVVVNLYPFEQAFKKGLKGHELIENIDIGGPTLLRAAAKNHERLTVVCDPSDYTWVSQKNLTLEDRQKLAIKVFEHTSFYDSLVVRGLKKDLGAADFFPRELTLGIRKVQPLRYGENPHQAANWYADPLATKETFANAEILQGKELSYNNLLDLDSALLMLKANNESFPSHFGSVIVKHNSPCGVALSTQNLSDAFQKSWDGDSVSAFGGIVALNKKVDAATAKLLTQLFLECVVAPDYDSEALQLLAPKKNLRLLKLKSTETGFAELESTEVRSIMGGLLIQQRDLHVHRPNDRFESVGAGLQPTPQIISDLVFLNNVARGLKSNAIAVGAGLQTLGLCGGQTNRVDAVQKALERARAHEGHKNTDLCLASDAFFPFRDSVDLAHRHGVKWIIQPGGSVKDEEVKAAARDLGIGMLFTGKRHFKH